MLIAVSISASFAQEITGKWYSYIYENGQPGLWTYEFLPNGKFNMTLSMEMKNQQMTIKIVSGFSGTYTRSGKALSVNGDKNTINTTMDVIYSQEVKDAMSQRPELKKYMDNIIAQQKPQAVRDANRKLSLLCAIGTYWQITRLTKDVWHSITKNGERTYRVSTLMSYEEYQKHLNSVE